MDNPLITLTTDFGDSGGYTAAMKGVILGICPDVQITDISHNIRPQNVIEAAIVIASTTPYFPQNTIHVAVVDPGVGTCRKPLLIVTPSYFCIGPDNGIFSLLTSKYEDQSSVDVFELDRERFWRHPVSHTFHGRDIFAPIAAHLALGIEPEVLGSPIENFESLSLPSPVVREGLVLGKIVYIDHFGNLISNIKSDEANYTNVIEIAGHVINGIETSYASSPGLLAIIGSHGNLEVAWNLGNAANRIGARLGTPILLRN